MSYSLAVCLAYLIGLLLSSIAASLLLGTIAIPGSGLIALGASAAWGFAAPRHWRLGWRPLRWGGLGIVILLATLYMTMRTPTASAQDVSQWVTRANAIAPNQIIIGRVIEDPRLNRDLKGRFLASVQQLQILDADGVVTFQMSVQGRVYVTAPLLQTTGLHAGQRLKAWGSLYLPSAAMNPNSFDFQKYLAQRQTFTGFTATELRFPKTSPWGLWRVRQRIVRAQVTALGSPLGQLVSAMALGRKAVDLPTDIQDLFMQVGLAHTIAASGFHVTLLLGVVLALLRSFSSKVQFIVGCSVLISYVALTGAQASVVRAALMGAATLVGLMLSRQVKPSGALLSAITLMLLVNPQWLWSISFQLSVMATWGLIVTIPAILKRLDWLPIAVASAVAVPIAATLWTLPLTLYHFNVLAGLSIVLNVVAMPLILVISLGGIASSALMLVSPVIGGIVAKLLYGPVKLLWWLAQTSSHLPGSPIAIGQIQLWQLVGLYAVLFCLLNLHRWQVKLLKPMLAIAFLALLTLPVGWRWLTQDQVTILASDELVWLQQRHGHTTLISGGDAKTAFYTVDPFLTQSGVNHIDEAIALPPNPGSLSGWPHLLTHFPTQHLYGLATIPKSPVFPKRFQALPVGTTTTLETLTVQLLGAENPIMRLRDRQDWLLLPELSLSLQTHLAKAGPVLQSPILVWPGNELSSDLLQVVKPQIVICYGQSLSVALERDLQQNGVQVFWTQRDGAITWQPQRGFRSYLESPHRLSLPWE